MRRLKPISYPLLDFNRIPTHRSCPDSPAPGEIAHPHQCVDVAAPKPAKLLRFFQSNNPARTPLRYHTLNILLTVFHSLKPCALLALNGFVERESTHDNAHVNLRCALFPACSKRA